MRGPGRLRRFGLIAGVVACSVIAAGCDTVTGGGWIQSASLVPGERATFAFSARCKNTTVDGIPTAVMYQGQFEYDDRAFDPRVRVHGTVVPDAIGTVPGQTCREVAAGAEFPVARFQGVFRTKPEVIPVVQGEFLVEVIDLGEGGPLTGDEICVSLFGPIPALYPPRWCQPVQGGNIQIQ